MEIPVPMAAGCMLAALAGLKLRGSWRLRVILAAFGLAAGLLWTAGYDWYIVRPARQLDGRQETITVTVTGWPEEVRSGLSLPAELSLQRGPVLKLQLYASGEGYDALQPGDTVTLSARLRLANTSYGEETYTRYARGTFLIANARGTPAITPASKLPLRFYPALAARSLRESIARCFSDQTAPLISALVTGDQSGLSGPLSSALRRAGLSHTVAVSGLHVGFLAGLAATLLGRFRRRSALVSILLMVLFALMTGGSPSVVRAAVLQSLSLLAPLVNREYDPATGLSAALMLLLLWNPYAAASVGLQLSFASVAGISLLSGPLNARWTARLPTKPKAWHLRLGCGVVRLCAASLSTTAGALLFTTPLTACYFGFFSLVAPLSNLLGLWAVSLSFLGGLGTALLGLIAPVAGRALALLTALPARCLIALALGLAKLPYAALPLDSPCLVLWLILVYAVALACRFVRSLYRPVIPLTACGITLCAALLSTALSAGGGTLSVAVLDVGQGESVLFSSGGRTALVDCGGSGYRDPGDVAADAIQRLGGNRLDLLVLTHCHADHSNGIPQLLSRLSVDTLLLPAALPEEDTALRQEILAAATAQGTRILLVEEDCTAVLGEAILQIFAPLGTESTNEAGLSILCTAGEFDVLVTGDMDAEIEALLTAHTALPKVELLVAGHHGSASSTSQQLLNTIRPDYAAISVGYNSYGHPRTEVLLRLADVGCQIYRTDWMGTIRFTVP